jgi:hypothetical protein
VVSSGYDISLNGDQPALDTGDDQVDIIFDNVNFEYVQVVGDSSSYSAVNIHLNDCEVRPTTGVAMTSYSKADATEEGTDFVRPSFNATHCRFYGPKWYEKIGVTSSPFGNHFIYVHPTSNVSIEQCELRGCKQNGVQFQGESHLAGPGQQSVIGNLFEENGTHMIGAQSQDDRSRTVVANNTFKGEGRIQFRGDFLFADNYVEVNTSPALGLVDQGTDDSQRDFAFSIKDNNFVIKNWTASNSVIDLVRDGIHHGSIENNVFRRDDSLAVGTVLFLGQLGSVATTDLAYFYFSNNKYLFDGTGGFTGWNSYSANVQFKNEYVKGMENLFSTTEVGSGGVIDVSDCEWVLDAAGATEKIAMACAHTGWTITGKGNKLGNASYVVDDENQFFLHLRRGRNPTAIAAAIEIFPDASYTEHEVAGITQIQTITLGTTGNIVANAVSSSEHQDAFTGSITLILEDGITIGHATLGNITNGPYVTVGAEAIDLLRTSAGNWIIKE